MYFPTALRSRKQRQAELCIIVQKGPHAKLLKETEEKYYELWNAQAKYYQEVCYHFLLDLLEIYCIIF